MIAHIRKNNDDHYTIQTVEEHCLNVSEYAAESGKSIGLENLMRLTGLLHDIGKNTNAFSEYITASFYGKTKFGKKKINHSSAGAQFIIEFHDSACLTKSYSDLSKLTKQLIAYAVFSHHGLYDALTPNGEDNYTKRIYPDTEIYYATAVKNSSNFISDSKVSKLLSEAVNEVSVIKKKIMVIKESMTNEQKGLSEKFFLYGCLERIILSMLIDSDRRDASEFDVNKKQKLPTHNECLEFFEKCIYRLENRLIMFNQKENRNHIDMLRQEMSDKCRQFAVEHNDGIYRCSIPTGGGKTYASMRFALNLCLRLQKERIFYIAPYLSILEQNAADLKSVFENDNYILEHHSNVFYENENSEQLKHFELLEDNWSAPLVLTTMVRFLDVLFGKSNSDIRRMHRLKNSVIIIDEAQAIPVRYIHQFNTMMNFLSGVCASTIIICTATQPLFEKVGRPLLYASQCDIIPDISKYSHQFKRAEIVTDYTDKPLNTDELTNLVGRLTKNNCLVILNTKSAVRKLADSIQKTLGEKYHVVQLTTLMCAQHRLDVIDNMKNELICGGGMGLICISTQLIEAGVDISFETVVRSLAGLDSIAQAAGRCNRNGRDENLGKTYIVRYSEEKISSLPDIKKARDAMNIILCKKYNDLLMPESISNYYKQYFFERAEEMDCPLPQISSETTMYELLADNFTGRKEYTRNTQTRYPYLVPQSFKTAAENFNVIDHQDTVGLIVYYKDSQDLISSLCCTEKIETQKKNLSKLQRYTVNVGRSSAVFKKLMQIGAFEHSLFDGTLFILDRSYYKDYGVTSELAELVL